MPRVAQGVTFAVVLGLVLLATRPAGACPADAEERAAAIDATLARQAHKAKVWDRAWAITFGTVALGQTAMGLGHWVPGRPYDADARAGVWVGVAKSAIGSLSHLIVPLKMVRARATTDPCEHLLASAAALDESRKHEKVTFYLNHAGSLALNVGGLLLLGLAYDTWKEGLMSFAIGYPVGLLSVYTQPRGAWHAAVVRTADYTGLAIAGSF